MSILTTPSGAFPTSLIYITVGTLIDIWTIVSLIFYPPETDLGRFVVWGLLITGFALLVIGLLLGQIGRAARNAEMPPTEVTNSVAQAEQTAAANPAPVVPVAGAPQGTAPVMAQPNVPNVPPAPAVAAPAGVLKR